MKINFDDENPEYSILSAFERIERELIDSMMRNFARHKAEEDSMGINWSMWQAEQLKNLEAFRQQNQKKYSGVFSKINDLIGQMLHKTYDDAQADQERDILNEIISGAKTSKQPGLSGSFFGVNERKLQSLITATTGDFEKAETAILRRVNDQYRKIILDAQVYANTGAGTYEKAVDMATKDFLMRGIDCIEYKNGRRVNIKSYAEMAIRTANKRAQLQGEGAKRQEWGISTVIIHKRGGPCPLCLPFVGKVFIDDVWSGGKPDGKGRTGKSPVTGVEYPLLSTAVEAGLYHPNCKDGHSTYYEGVSEAETGYTKEELNRMADEQKRIQREQYAGRQEEKYERLAQHSLDKENKQGAEEKLTYWEYVKSQYEDKVLIKDWFLSKNFSEPERYAISRSDLSIVKETEKAVFVRAASKYGDMKFWCPKSCLSSPDEIIENLQKREAAFERGRDAYNKLVEFAKSNGVKGVRVGMKKETILKKIKEAGIEYRDGAAGQIINRR